MSFLLQEMLLEPERVPGLDPDQFNQLIPQGRNSRLLASLALELEQAGILEQVPAPVRRHLHSAVLIHEKQKRDLAYDTGKIQAALNSIGEKLILLKGRRLPDGGSAGQSRAVDFRYRYHRTPTPNR